MGPEQTLRKKWCYDMVILDDANYSDYGVSYTSKRTQEALDSARALHATATASIQEMGAARGLQELGREMDFRRREKALANRINELEKESMVALAERKVLTLSAPKKLPAVVVRGGMPVLTRPEKAGLSPEAAVSIIGLVGLAAIGFLLYKRRN